MVGGGESNQRVSLELDPESDNFSPSLVEEYLNCKFNYLNQFSTFKKANEIVPKAHGFTSCLNAKTSRFASFILGRGLLGLRAIILRGSDS